ncbi:serine/arginine repetitive matrix protein 1 isoform X2 [Sesamum indicum]|uniref:Serine/arginine repetitive matrix protein 1 isoform X2 n=1 Tax=Sesamum indicum TaxID=4182 RepID=A0A6I9TH26_SESIN|nr:serine/arginine repetitive matrix protein 1 isoform X2 [Sesamum indicum]
MDSVVDANIPLDYIEFHIFPSQNRYEACVCNVNMKEKVASGLLEHLLVHSAEVKALHSKGSDVKYILKSPENQDNKWFTKSVLIRFLHIIGLANLLHITSSVKDEISQLEEARRFHLSLYAKGTEYQLQTGESGNSCSSGTVSTPKTEGSDASKNELLRAMDLRLAALRGELTTVFDQAADFGYFVEEMTNVEKFSHHFGAVDLRDSLGMYIELRQGNQAVDISSNKQFAETDGVREKEGCNYATKPLSSETPVKYGVSPAKVAQVERQSSTESDESSFSSDEEKPSIDRSRTLIRSASPRRSASPMRRVQIGRSGSRRSTAITIKSLNYIPAREKSLLPKDPVGHDSDEEGSERAPIKSESNVRRMSVQDAINLFESKQRDQTEDIQKAKSLLNASMAANRSVLRRWSSGMDEDSSECLQDLVPGDAVSQTQYNVESKETANSSPEGEAEPGVASEDYPTEICGLDAKLNSPDKIACSPVVTPDENLPTESSNANAKLTSSVEWSRQKEAELNELLMKMMETKPAKNRTAVPDRSKRQSFPAERRGGFYNHYKEKRDEKLQAETVTKKAEKDKQFRAMQQILDARKSQQTSAATGDAGKKTNVKKLQKSQNNASQPANPRTESPKLGFVKKAPPKASSLPATRKSWPSVPPPRTPGESPARTPSSSTLSNPPRRRSQPTAPVSRSGPKVETSQPQAKSTKSNQNSSKSNLRIATEKKQQPLQKTMKAMKSKAHGAPQDLASSAKPSLYSKVTKKGSVVPLESKPFLRKGSGTLSNINPVVKIKASSNPPETSRSTEDPILTEDNEAVSNSFDQPIQPQEKEPGELKIHMDIESRSPAESPQRCGDKEAFTQVSPIIHDAIDREVQPELKVEDEEEPTIAPTAWVEIEENEDQPLRSSEHICQPGSLAPVVVSGERVRHSLSQMLLEESSEQDVIDWGNAENPPPMAYQKDAPKGLKRLLKFARKSKTASNATGWSSPSVFSEGEDDTEDSKSVSKRSYENLLKKATLHSKNNGHQKATYETYQKNYPDYEHPAQANIRKFNAQSLSQQLQEGHVSASVTTTKATRSFFSLSAFKGSK